MEGGGPRRATAVAIRDVAIEEAGKRTSPISGWSAERVTASAETTAGIASGCPVYPASNVVVGRSDAIATSEVMGPTLAPAGPRTSEPTSVAAKVSDTTDHTRTTPMSAVTALRGRASIASTR